MNFLTKHLKWIAFLSIWIIPNIAMAMSGPFSSHVQDGDIAKGMLDAIFGPLTGSGSNPFGEVMMIFNSAMLTVGGILVFYTLAAGTLQTAHDGQMLGKQWSSIWIPVRTAVGAAVLMPTIQGFSVIQAIVIWLAIQGVGLANLMWNSFMKDPLEGAFYVPPSSALQIRALVSDMAKSNICVAALLESQRLIPNVVQEATQNISVVPFPLGMGYVYAGGLCGNVRGFALIQNSASNLGNAITGSTPSSLQIVDENKLRNALVPVHQRNLGRIQEQLATASKKIAANEMTQEEFVTLYNQLVTQYVNDLSQEARNIYNAEKDEISAAIQEKMKQDGFAMAGAFYVNIAKAQDIITNAISSAPTTASGPALKFARGGFLGDVEDALLSTSILFNGEDLKSIMLRGNSFIQAANDANSTALQMTESRSSEDSWVIGMISWFMNDAGMGGIFGSEFAQSNANPVMVARNLGDKMTAAAWMGAGIGGGILAASTVQVAGTGLGGGFAAIGGSFLMMIFSLLFVPGATLSTYVPMVPYIMWLGAFFGWLILVVEAVFGSPIWAVSHLAPDGDAVVGRGGHGYMLVLSLVLRPALMILGLMAAIVLMKPIGALVNTTFLGAFAMSTEPGPLSFTKLIMGCILYMVVVISMMHKVFGLMYMVPDRILRWIGGGDNVIGENAQGTNDMVKGSALAVAGTAGGIGSQMANLGEKFRDNKRNEMLKKNGEADTQRDQENAQRLQASRGDSQVSGALSGAQAEQQKAGIASEKADMANSKLAQDPENKELQAEAKQANKMAEMASQKAAAAIEGFTSAGVSAASADAAAAKQAARAGNQNSNLSEKERAAHKNEALRAGAWEEKIASARTPQAQRDLVEEASQEKANLESKNQQVPEYIERLASVKKGLEEI